MHWLLIVWCKQGYLHVSPGVQKELQKVNDSLLVYQQVSWYRFALHSTILHHTNRLHTSSTQSTWCLRLHFKYTEHLMSQVTLQVDRALGVSEFVMTRTYYLTRPNNVLNYYLLIWSSRFKQIQVSLNWSTSSTTKPPERRRILSLIKNKFLNSVYRICNQLVFLKYDLWNMCATESQ